MNIKAGGYDFTWDQMVEWYSGLPIYGQILVILGICAILTLIVIGVYYLIKGIAYLVYYILKGVYYLLRAIVFGIYKFFEELYYLISGKPKPIKQKNVTIVQSKVPSESHELIQGRIQEYKPKINYFCSECGIKFSDKMMYQIASKGIVFCEHCGKGYKLVKDTGYFTKPDQVITPIL